MGKALPRRDEKPAVDESEQPLEVSTLAEVQARADQIEKNQAAIQLLRSWREGDEQEQRETWEYLKKALDEDRLSDRKAVLRTEGWR